MWSLTICTTVASLSYVLHFRNKQQAANMLETWREAVEAWAKDAGPRFLSGSDQFQHDFLVDLDVVAAVILGEIGEEFVLLEERSYRQQVAQHRANKRVATSLNLQQPTGARQ